MWTRLSIKILVRLIVIAIGLSIIVQGFISNNNILVFITGMLIMVYFLDLIKLIKLKLRSNKGVKILDYIRL